MKFWRNAKTMANRQNSKFGPDGYKELHAKEKAMKSSGKSTGSPRDKKLMQDKKEIEQLRKKDYAQKKKSSRLSKLIVPRGSGHSSALGRQRK